MILSASAFVVISMSKGYVVLLYSCLLATISNMISGLSVNDKLFALKDWILLDFTANFSESQTHARTFSVKDWGGKILFICKIPWFPILSFFNFKVVFTSMLDGFINTSILYLQFSVLGMKSPLSSSSRPWHLPVLCPPGSLTDSMPLAAWTFFEG